MRHGHSWGNPITYRGIEFRSQTEARWAKYFDSLELQWAYESITFRSGAARYTPDFSIYDDSIFVEVKAGLGTLYSNRWKYLVIGTSEFVKPFGNRVLLTVIGQPESIVGIIREGGECTLQGIFKTWAEAVGMAN